MDTTGPEQQFIRLPFGEPDSLEFMRLVRSPESSTYLTLRRYIGRSSRPHNCALEPWFARGYLCCELSRARIARYLGEPGIRGRGARLTVAKVEHVEGTAWRT